MHDKPGDVSATFELSNRGPVESLNITILGINYAPETTGGIAPYMTDLAESLGERGHKVHVVTGYPHYPAWEIDASYHGRSIDEVVNGVHVHRRRHFVPSPPNALGRIKMELSFGARAASSGWNTPDVIVCTSPALLATAMVLGRARLTPKRPAIGGVWVHDLYGQGVVETGAMTGRSARATSRLEAAVVKSADGIAVVHDRFVDHVVNELHVPRERVTVVRNWTHVTPIDVDDLTAARTKFGWSPDETIVLHTGNMGVKQGLENVVEAARLADEQSLPIRFVLVGDGNQRPNLEAAAVGVDRIDFVRPLDDQDFRTAMAAADVLLVNEAPGIVGMAVPSKLTSYFSSGTPIVAATDVASTTATRSVPPVLGGSSLRTVIPQACSLQPYNSRRRGDFRQTWCRRGPLLRHLGWQNRVHRQMRKVDPRAGGRPQLVRELLGTKPHTSRLGSEDDEHRQGS